VEEFMVDLVNILTQTDILLDSDLLGTLIASYFFLLCIVVVSFVNIYSVDKFEFLNNQQNCFEFKHKMFFVIMYSKEKHIVSKKTLISEIIGYIISVASIVVLICSLKQDVNTAIILLGIVSLVIFTFGCITGVMYRKIKK
jgi:small-conductance mechanosensitive channel